MLRIRKYSRIGRNLLLIIFCGSSLIEVSFNLADSKKKHVAQKLSADTISLYKSSGPISLKGVHNRIIDGLTISNSKVNCIQLVNCTNILIKNCRLLSSKGNGVDIYNCKGITVTNCYMEDVVTGVYALDSQHININHLRVKNVHGPLPRGQMVQFDHVTGTRNRVCDNRCENILGESNPEDIINMFKTSGTMNDPVEISGNLIRGGGPSANGGGIMLGDYGGSYITAKDNILVNPGQYGIGIASGTHIQIINNIVFARQQPFTNVGIYIWNQTATTCAMNVISGNKVNWTNSKGEANDSWDNGNCGKVEGWDTNFWDAKIDESIIPKNFLTQ